MALLGALNESCKEMGIQDVKPFVEKVGPLVHGWEVHPHTEAKSQVPSPDLNLIEALMAGPMQP